MNAATISRIDTREDAMNANQEHLNQNGLGRFGLSQSQAEHLVEMLGRSTEISRRLVINALRQLGDAAVPILARRLADKQVATRQAAADALRQMDNTSAATAELTAALFDTDWLVRIRAAEALGRATIRDEKTIAALRHAQRNDPLVYVRLIAGRH